MSAQHGLCMRTLLRHCLERLVHGDVVLQLGKDRVAITRAQSCKGACRPRAVPETAPEPVADEAQSEAANDVSQFVFHADVLWLRKPATAHGVKAHAC